MPKLLYKVDLGNDMEAYLVTDGGRFLFYNLDGIVIATVPPGWQLVEALGMVEAVDDFEKLTGRRPELFLMDCRVCRQPALLLVEHDGGVCVDCQPERDEEGVNHIN